MFHTILVFEAGDDGRGPGSFEVAIEELDAGPAFQLHFHFVSHKLLVHLSGIDLALPFYSHTEVTEMPGIQQVVLEEHLSLLPLEQSRDKIFTPNFFTYWQMPAFKRINSS